MRIEFYGISESFNHMKEWKDGKCPIRKKESPALRATDYKCPKYVWYEMLEDTTGNE